MLSFDEWVAEVSRLQDAVRLNKDRMEYRMMELSCNFQEPGRVLSRAQQDLVDDDPAMKELRYLGGRYRAQLEYLKVNGVLPPEETL